MRSGNVGILISVLLSFIAVVGVGFAGYYVFSTSQKTVNSPNEVTPAPSKSNVKFPGTKQSNVVLAYTNNGNLNLLKTDGKTERVTTTGDMGFFKWVPGEEKIAYIKQTQVFGERIVQWVGISIEEIDLKTGQVRTLLPRQFTNEEIVQTEFRNSLFSFDFSPNGKQIAFVRDGFFIKNLSSGEIKKIGGNILDNDNPVKTQFYTNVLWSPDGVNVLTREQGWEWSIASIYNTQENKFIGKNLEGSGNVWNDSGSQILGYESNGMMAGGIWVYDLTIGKSLQYYGAKNPAINVYSGTFLPNGKVVAVIEPFEAEFSNGLLPSEEAAFYYLSYPEKLELIKTIPAPGEMAPSYHLISQLEPSKDGKNLFYFKQVGESKLDIEKLNLETKSVSKLVVGISYNQTDHYASLQVRK